MPFMQYSGSPTPLSEGSILINSPDRVFCSNLDVVSKTQMWIAIRAQPGFASTDANEHTFFRFGPSTNEEIFIQYGAAAGALAGGREQAGSGTTQPIVSGLVFSAGSDCTFIAAWTATTASISFNGAAQTVTANVRDPDMTGVTGWDLGQRGYSATGFANSDFFWAATGLGTISDANITTIHGLANTGIGLEDFPVAPAFFWAGSNQQFYAPVAAYWVAA